MTIIFSNSGEIDIRAATIIGANVKTGPSPIGYFGTGLKYAIAGTLRLGGKIEIHSGTSVFRFATEEIEIRGKIFNIIRMYDTVGSVLELGFTTELGKNWEDWMIYRELYCNALDEPDSQIELRETDPRPIAGRTQVLLHGDVFENVHANRADFILSAANRGDKIVLKHYTSRGNIELEVYDKPGDNIFYRGIAVHELAQPSALTYNFLSPLSLTEDRTASWWEITPRIIAILSEHTNVPGNLLRNIMTTEDYVETKMDWSYINRDNISKEFLSTFNEITASSDAGKIPQSLRDSMRPKDEAKRCPTCGQMI